LSERIPSCERQSFLGEGNVRRGGEGRKKVSLNKKKRGRDMTIAVVRVAVKRRQGKTSRLGRSRGIFL